MAAAAAKNRKRQRKQSDMIQNSKLGLDYNTVSYAKGVAKKIADDVQLFVESYTTVAVERTLCRLLGIVYVD